MKKFLDFADSKAFVSCPDTKILFDGENGFLLYGVNDNLINCHADDATTANKIVSLIPNSAKLISARGKVLADLLTEKGFSVKNECFQFEYHGSTLKAVPSVYNVRQIGEEYIDEVATFHHDRKDYVLSLLKKGVFLGAFDGKTLVGVVGEHARGTIGLLFVKDEYRRKGIARLLMTEKTNRVLADGRTPVLHVVDGNTASFNLQKNIGYALLPDKVYWMA